MKGVAYHGWKVGLPDKFWPVSLDNFFDNPDEIRELGLHLLEQKAIKSNDEGGIWPGYISETLQKTHGDIHRKITEKILNCYFNTDLEQVFYNCNMRFNLISSIDKDKNNLKNKGWIHRDGIEPRLLHHPTKVHPAQQPQLAGLIYLTPDIERDTGTSLFDMKKDKTLDDFDESIEMRIPLFKGYPVSDEVIKEKWEKHRSCFIEKTRFENIYNRLIMYDVKEFHAANSYYTSKDNRLTLGFFIGGILANKWPLERVRNITHNNIRYTKGEYDEISYKN
jgi:hypothetical protein